MDEFDESYPNSAFLLDMIKTFYDYPLKTLAQLPRNQYVVIRFDDLVANPGDTVRHIYDTLGYQPGAAFLHQLDEETRLAARHTSDRTVVLSDLGLDEAAFDQTFRKVLDHYSFPHPDSFPNP